MVVQESCPTREDDDQFLETRVSPNKTYISVIILIPITTLDINKGYQHV